MIQNAYSSGSKYILVLMCCLLSTYGFAQKAKPMKSTFESFLDTQWWLGVRFGMNYSQPSPAKRFSAFSPIDYEPDQLEKDYRNFQDIGAMAGMDLSFYHKGFSIGLQPSYKRVNFSYTNELFWVGETGQFETVYEVNQFLNFVEVPLTLQYEVYQRGQIRPFVFAGLHYSFLVSAGKDAKVRNRNESGIASPGGKFSLGVTNQFQNYYGALGGVGAAFDYFNVRAVLNASYQYALSTITNPKNQYQDNELSSLGEANDKINLHNINVSLSLVFPLRYIDKTFQPY